MIPSVVSLMRSIAGLPKKDDAGSSSKNVKDGVHCESPDRVEDFGFVLLDDEKTKHNAAGKRSAETDSELNVDQKKSNVLGSSSTEDNRKKEEHLSFQEEALMGIPFQLSSVLRTILAAKEDKDFPRICKSEELDYDFELERSVINRASGI